MRIGINGLLSLLVIIMIMVFPVILGMGLYRLFRWIKPQPKIELNFISDIDQVGDRFFIKSLVIGWAICGPCYYWIYHSQLF